MLDLLNNPKYNRKVYIIIVCFSSFLLGLAALASSITAASKAYLSRPFAAFASHWLCSLWLGSPNPSPLTLLWLIPS